MTEGIIEGAVVLRGDIDIGGGTLNIDMSPIGAEGGMKRDATDC